MVEAINHRLGKDKLSNLWIPLDLGDSFTII